jgi:hypothetical protein
MVARPRIARHHVQSGGGHALLSPQQQRSLAKAKRTSLINMPYVQYYFTCHFAVMLKKKINKSVALKKFLFLLLSLLDA